MHVDPHSVVDIGYVNVTNTLFHLILPNIVMCPPSLLYMHPPIPPSPLSPSLLPPLSASVTHYLSFYPHLSLSLQNGGWSALMLASKNGHIEAIKLLLTAPDIDVNHADVSHYLLTLSCLVPGGGFITHLPHLISHSI